MAHLTAVFLTEIAVFVLTMGRRIVYDGNILRKFGVLTLAGGSELKNFVRTVAIDPDHPEIIYAGMHLKASPNLTL